MAMFGSNFQKEDEALPEVFCLFVLGRRGSLCGRQMTPGKSVSPLGVLSVINKRI